MKAAANSINQNPAASYRKPASSDEQPQAPQGSQQHQISSLKQQH
jgi:hypothetical protein